MNARQSAFVDEYLKDRNATQAAIRAGYSAKTAKQVGSRLLTNVDIASAVEERTAAIAAEARADAVWLLRRLVLLADVKIADLFTPGGELREPADMPEGAQLLIAGIEVETTPFGVKRKVKLESRMKALEMIGKHVDVGAFVERILVEDEGSLAEDLLKARKRAREMRGGKA